MGYVKYNGRCALVENTHEYIKGRALNNCKPDSRNVFGGSSPCWMRYTCINRFIAASLFFPFFFSHLTAHHHYAFHYFIAWSGVVDKVYQKQGSPCQQSYLGSQEGRERQKELFIISWYLLRIIYLFIIYFIIYYWYLRTT